jgi:ribosomal protein S16
VKITIKKLTKDNFEIFVVNEGKFIARIGNFISYNQNEYFRLNFNLLKKYISSGAIFSKNLKKKCLSLFFIL